MIDRTVYQAVKGRAKTAPAENASRPKAAPGKNTSAPGVIATAVAMARRDRIERDIAAYAIRKREES